MLLPQTHSPAVDYSLFIMEMVETLLGEMETTPAALRRSFPPPICRSRSLFRGFFVSVAPPSGKRQGTIFIFVFRSKGSFGKKDRRKRSHEGQVGGPHAAKESGRMGPLFWPSGFHFFASFAPTLCSFQKLMLVNFQVILTSFGSMKHQNIENRVFCQCRVNSRKIGKL